MGSSFRWASKRSKGMKGGVKVRHPGKPKKWIAGTAKAFLSAPRFMGGLGDWGGWPCCWYMIYIYICTCILYICIYLNGNIQWDQTKGSTTTKKVPVPPKKKCIIYKPAQMYGQLSGNFKIIIPARKSHDRLLAWHISKERMMKSNFSLWISSKNRTKGLKKSKRLGLV